MSEKKKKNHTAKLLTIAGIYSYLILPRLFHKPDRKNFDSHRLYAHRGLFDNKGDAPENSLLAFKRACDAGFGIELDVHLTSDGIPVVYHDFKLDRVAHESGVVEDYTLKELQSFRLENSKETIPTLQEVLDLVAGRVPIIVEYKTESVHMREVRVLCEKTDALLRDYERSCGKIAYSIESFDPIVLIWYRAHRPEIVRGQLVDNYLQYRQYWTLTKAFPAWGLEKLLANVATRPDFIAFNYHFTHELSWFLCCRLFGARAVAWTIKSQKELDRMEPKCDALIFDSFVPEDVF